MELDDFERLAKTRRSVRHFKSDPIPDGVLDRLLDIARWAPSGYNLQPTHFVLVTNPELKPALRRACMDQPQISEAPATVVFAGDRRVVANNFERSLAMDKECGSMTPEYEAALRKFVPLAFGAGPAGLGWLGKALGVPVARLFTPLPEIPAVHKRYWLAKQTLLCAMNFMLAAHAAGLSTVPMEGFDEGRVKRVLGIPRSTIVTLVIPVGYAATANLAKSRLPLESVVHRNGW